MATKSVTKTVEFDHAPAYPGGLMQVNAGIDTCHSLGLASVLVCFVQQRLVEGVSQGEIVGDEAYVHAFLLDAAKALYKASGAEA